MTWESGERRNATARSPLLNRPKRWDSRADPSRPPVPLRDTVMQQPTLSDQEFARFRNFIHGAAGISLAPTKKSLVAGRLAKRLRHHGLTSFGDYYHLVSSERAERQIAVDLLTTNETHFFREPRHFDLLRDQFLPAHPRDRLLRVWSAACSSGEEVYTLAMVLADTLGDASWEVLGSDISTRVLEQASRGSIPWSVLRN